MKLIKEGTIFGKIRAGTISNVFAILISYIYYTILSDAYGIILTDIYTIEFQKRGLPHAHTLIKV